MITATGKDVVQIEIATARWRTYPGYLSEALRSDFGRAISWADVKALQGTRLEHFRASRRSGELVGVEG